MLIRPAIETDRDSWLVLRRALWPREGSNFAESHAGEIDRYFAGWWPMPSQVLVAEGEDGGLLGFVELSIRPYAEGCDGDRVAYLEGWYVVPEARRMGVGRALVAAAEGWGRRQGCRELASDTEVSNAVSSEAHQRLGFEEVEVIRCFMKEL